MIAEKVSQLQPVVVDRNGVVVDGGVNIYSLLRKPNAVQRYSEFMMQLATDFLIYNNAYVHLSNNTSYKSKYITPVCDRTVTITETDGVRNYTVNNTGFYSSINGLYVQKHNENDGRIVGANKLGELIHIKGYLGQNETKATSKLLALAQDAQIVEKSLLQVASFLDRGYSGSGILQTNFKNQDKFEMFKKDLSNYYTGAQNEGRMMALNGTEVAVHMHNNRSNKDMQANENKEQSKMAIYQRYDIPEPLVNSGSQTYNNYQTALYALYENAVFPTFNSIFDAISESFITRNILNPEYRITCDS
jgi:phage portal protein BeeE